MASGATGLTMKPASRARAATAAERSPASVMARSRPAPRMPVTSGCPRRRSRALEVLAGLAGVVEQALGSIVSSTASPAAQASGLPPKVEPCMPGVSRC